MRKSFLSLNVILGIKKILLHLRNTPPEWTHWGSSPRPAFPEQDKKSYGGIIMKDCENCAYGREEWDYRGCRYYTCGRPGGCYDRETYELKTPPHDPRMGIDRNDPSTW